MEIAATPAMAPAKTGAEILESLGITLRLRGGMGAPGKGASPGRHRTHEAPGTELAVRSCSRANPAFCAVRPPPPQARATLARAKVSRRNLPAALLHRGPAHSVLPLAQLSDELS